MFERLKESDLLVDLGVFFDGFVLVSLYELYLLDSYQLPGDGQTKEYLQQYTTTLHIVW